MLAIAELSLIIGLLDFIWVMLLWFLFLFKTLFITFHVSFTLLFFNSNCEVYYLFFQSVKQLLKCFYIWYIWLAVRQSGLHDTCNRDFFSSCLWIFKSDLLTQGLQGWRLLLGLHFTRGIHSFKELTRIYINLAWDKLTSLATNTSSQLSELSLSFNLLIISGVIFLTIFIEGECRDYLQRKTYFLQIMDNSQIFPTEWYQIKFLCRHSRKYCHLRCMSEKITEWVW